MIEISEVIQELEAGFPSPQHRRDLRPLLANTGLDFQLAGGEVDPHSSPVKSGMSKAGIWPKCREQKKYKKTHLMDKRVLTSRSN